MEISVTMVKELRDKTGVGIMDCKKALEETQGDIKKAIDYLRQKGIAKAMERAGRSTKEGVIVSYIHPGSKLGVLVEVNCETDFVARTEDFQNLARDIAMQIAATNPLAVSRETLSSDIIEREKEVYRAQARNEGKPEKIIEKIIEGKIEKFYQESCLLDQAFIRDADKTIRDLLAESIGKIGENITIRRFARFRLGEE